ncbi:MAG TPA: hypothetical protein DCY42_05535 [Chloroflexi bacterium]|nr:hypothetical protein [Chloroflexota bacterium]
METELSPLDQIRQCEAEMARKIAATQEQTKQKITKARKEAREIVERARQRGLVQGQEKGIEVLSLAEQEAQSVLQEAQNQAEDLRLRGTHLMEEAVCFAVKFVLGFEKVKERK